MEIAHTTVGDILSVLDRLSDQHEAEYEKGGGKHRLADAMISFFCRGEARTLWFDGKPQAVLAIADALPGIPVTWLAVTKEFFAKGIGPTRAARRYMQDAVKRHGPIMSIVRSDHPGAEKWMKTIGFRLLEVNGDAKIFLFPA